MSIAPANSASMAAGPALKLVHWTLTCGPMALSNHPLALPTMACACVMLGNAPTRIVFVPPCAPAEIAVASASMSIVMQQRLFTLLASDHHGENAGVFLLILPTLGGLAGSW